VRGLLAALLLVLCATRLGAPAATAQAGMPTMSAAALLDSLAVNTHINYTDTAYADVRKVADDLAWLGVHHIREGTPTDTAPVSSYVYLAKRGIRFNLVIRADVAQSLRQLDVLNAAAPGSVAAVEGFNEIDNFPVTYEGLKGDAAGLAAQKAIYAHVHGEPTLAGVPVYDLTGFDIERIATRAEAADLANAHFYPQNGQQPAWNANGGGAWLAWSIDGRRKFGLPLVVTEFGYTSMPQSGWLVIGVNEATQAKGVLNGLMDTASAGVTRTYVYELLDEKPDPQNLDGQQHFGLFRNDHSPKPVANAIRNITAILRTPGESSTGSAQSGTPAWTLTGLPPSGRSLLLQQSDGRLVLVLWNETPIWDRATGKPLQSPPVKIQIDFGKTVGRVDVYDPLVSATPLASRPDVRGFAVDVPDHPVLIEFTPGRAEPA
jgi:hypothetical protein